jgi:ribose 5-phosphate isomerase
MNLLSYFYTKKKDKLIEYIKDDFVFLDYSNKVSTLTSTVESPTTVDSTINSSTVESLINSSTVESPINSSTVDSPVSTSNLTSINDREIIQNEDKYTNFENALNSFITIFLESTFYDEV